jgi:hypothetical protein
MNVGSQLRNYFFSLSFLFGSKIFFPIEFFVLDLSISIDLYEIEFYVSLFLHYFVNK